MFPVGPVSGAHLNPVVTLADRVFGGLSTAQAMAYMVAQVAGGVIGVVVANLMFDLPALQVSTRVRSSPGLWLAEVVATFGLLLVIFGVVRSRRASVAPFAVGAYIGGAYFFTASTSFANPAVTLARMLSNTFAGIAPASAPAFICGSARRRPPRRRRGAPAVSLGRQGRSRRRGSPERRTVDRGAQAAPGAAARRAGARRGHR